MDFEDLLWGDFSRLISSILDALKNLFFGGAGGVLLIKGLVVRFWVHDIDPIVVSLGEIGHEVAFIKPVNFLLR